MPFTLVLALQGDCGPSPGLMAFDLVRVSPLRPSVAVSSQECSRIPECSCLYRLASPGEFAQFLSLQSAF